MAPQSLFNVDDPSAVGNARRAAMGRAASLGFSDERAGKVGLAVVESATNILKHAGHGQLLIGTVESEGVDGVEIIALDKGPGIANVSASLRDGHSTAGSMGGGLGALARLSYSFEIFTQPGKGTALRLALWSREVAQRAQPIEVGGISVAKQGETVCGDAWAVDTSRDQIVLLMADGLGHGIGAHEASRAAIEVLRTHPRSDPREIIEISHGALARTRGAAVAVARLVASGERGIFAGVGNIVCRVEASSANRHLVSHNGTVGTTLRKVQEFAFPWPVNALVVLHSDGLGTHWSLDHYPGLATRHPALIAAVLYRDYDRRRDDVTVAVVRNRGSLGSTP
jgi:anti-sigma regulatory factor (Ser/Thr protein kinase)